MWSCLSTSTSSVYTVANMLATDRRSHSRTHVTFCSRVYPPLGAYLLIILENCPFIFICRLGFWYLIEKYLYTFVEKDLYTFIKVISCLLKREKACTIFYYSVVNTIYSHSHFCHRYTGLSTEVVLSRLL